MLARRDCSADSRAPALLRRESIEIRLELTFETLDLRGVPVGSLKQLANLPVVGNYACPEILNLGIVMHNARNKSADRPVFSFESPNETVNLAVVRLHGFADFFDLLF